MSGSRGKSCCKSLTKLCFNTVKSFLQNTTFQGYHYLVDRNLHWTERLFWIICIIIISGYGFLLMLRSLVTYRTNPLSLTVDTNYINWQSDYPALVFCERAEEDALYTGISKYVGAKMADNDAELSKYAKDVLFYNGAVNFLRRCVNAEYMETEPDDEADKYEWEWNKEVCALFADNLVELKRFRRSCENLFANCSFNDVQFECCAKFLPIQTIYGECYAWNSMVALNSTEPLYTAGADDTGHLKVYLKQISDAYTFFAISREENLSYRESLNNIPFTGRSYYHTGDVYIKYKNMANHNGVRNVPLEIRRCRFPDENNLAMSQFYSFPACMTEELALKQLLVCNCTQYYLPERADAARFCTSLESVLCLSDNQGAILSNLRDHSCMTSCVESEVTIVGANSVNAYPNAADTPTYTNNTTGQPSWHAVVNFYFSAVRMRYHRRVLRDTVDLIVNVGGIGTLFFGASLISIIELLYYFLIFPCFSGQRNEKQKQKHKQAQSKSQQFKQPPKQQDDLVAYIDFKQRVFGDLKFRKTKVLPYRN